MTAQRLPQLDALTAIRGLAAWWVVFYHFAPFLYGHLPMDVWWLAKKGFLAVDLFFILSGFVIFYTYQNSLSANVTSVSAFLVKRLARVYPLHLLMLLGYFALVIGLLLVKNIQMDPEKFSAQHFAEQIFLVQAWGLDAGSALSWNYPAWSISAELAAYITFPFLLLLFNPQRWPTWALLAVIAALVALLAGYYHWLNICPTANALDPQSAVILSPQICSLNREIDLTAVPRCLTQFAIGMCLCILYLRAEAVRHRLAAPVMMAGVVLLLTGAILRWDDVYFAPLGWTLLVFGLACEPKPVRWLLCNRPMILLGDISYATYMCHALVREVYKFVFVQSTGDPYVPFYAPGWTLILIFVFILLLSWALYHWFERPAQRWAQHIFLPKRKVWGELK
jgi:peptidoglycan/LPS O-acetylase OafA/YrhL